MSEENTTSHSKTRRRNRIITSCLECRRRKLKCDRVHPCTHCVKGHRDCVFLAPARDPASKSKLNQFKESIETLEKKLETGQDDSLGSDWTATSHATRPSPASRSAPEAEQPASDDERNLEPTPFAMADVAYDDDGDETFDDLGVRLGRMRIAERIGGFVRPAFSEEFSFPFPTLQSDKSLDESSPRARKMSDSPDDQNTATSYLEPSSDYIAPGAGMLFPLGSVDDVSLINFLPSRELSDRLLDHYWTAVHPLARIVHRPTFERQYQQFWQIINTGFEPPNSLQALIFAAIFSAAVSVDEAIAQADLGISKKEVVVNLQAGCESALTRSNLLRTTKIDTLQAFVMYLIPLCRGEISRSHAALTSMAIRLATMAGLHKDGTVFGLLPVEVHVRRLIWHQLCFLDYRTCDAVGPPAQIRKEDFDTRMPLNIDDADLEAAIPPQQDADHWTDVTLTRIRFEYVNFSRELRVLQSQLEKKQTTITAVLRKVEEFRRDMERKFLPLIDETVSIQAFAQRILRLEGVKLHIRILNRYAVSAPQAMPPRLRQIVWFSGTSLIELGVDLETTLRFKDWAWYTGAIQQYHTALLLLAEVWSIPDRRLVDRIWHCFDYIFNIPKFLNRHEKTALVVNKAKSRLEEYKKRRKQRLPVAIQQRLNSVTSPAVTVQSSNVSPNASFLESNGYRMQPEHQNMSSESMSNISLNPGMDGVEAVDRSMSLPIALSGISNISLSQDTATMGVRPKGVGISPASANGLFPGMLPMTSAGQRGNHLNNASFSDQQLFDEMNVDWDELDKLFPLNSSMADSSTGTPESTNVGDFTLPYTSFLPFGMQQPLSYVATD